MIVLSWPPQAKISDYAPGYHVKLLIEMTDDQEPREKQDKKQR